jgi:DNA-binding response OmpR family regulator
MKIALIEDEPECFENYEAVLTIRGHEVKIYSEADDVVADLNRIAKYDLVILDLMIQLGTKIKPDEAPETGIAIYKRLRQINKNQKILVLTARLQSDVWNSFRDDKNILYLMKPVKSLEILYRAVEKFEK